MAFICYFYAHVNYLFMDVPHYITSPGPGILQWCDNIELYSKIVLTIFEFAFILSCMQRLLYEKIWKTLSAHKQMTFIAGPRQAGKTTFTQLLAKSFSNSLYYNWDIVDEKRKLIETPFFYEEVHRRDSSIPLIIFDELHKSVSKRRGVVSRKILHFLSVAFHFG
jgi:hypothetical protein